MKRIVSIVCFAALGLAAGCSGKDTDKGGDRPGAGGPHIVVLTGAENRKHFDDVKVGDTVKVKGEFLGKKQDGTISMHTADRYKGDEPAVRASELLKEYAADAAAADKKYKDKDLVVEGVLAELGAFNLKLAGSEK